MVQFSVEILSHAWGWMFSYWVIMQAFLWWQHDPINMEISAQHSVRTTNIEIFSEKLKSDHPLSLLTQGDILTEGFKLEVWELSIRRKHLLHHISGTQLTSSYISPFSIHLSSTSIAIFWKFKSLLNYKLVI